MEPNRRNNKAGKIFGIKEYLWIEQNIVQLWETTGNNLSWKKKGLRGRRGVLAAVTAVTGRQWQSSRRRRFRQLFFEQH